MNTDIHTNKLRVRSCGVLVEERKILLIKLKSPVTNQFIWTPPGGGVEFGESLKEALIREFYEETGLQISVQQRIHLNEIIQPPFHAVEIYFLVNRTGGKLQLGKDPEYDNHHQVLSDIGFFTRDEISNMAVEPDFFNQKFWNNFEQMLLKDQ